MKQKIGFLETDAAKFVLNILKMIFSNLISGIIGAMWVGLVCLFVMFFYQYRFVYYQKAILEDDKKYKESYRYM